MAHTSRSSLCRAEVLCALLNIVHVEEGYHPPKCAASRAELLYDTPVEGHKKLSSDSIVVGEGQVCRWSSYGIKKSLKVKKDYLINARKWMKGLESCVSHI